tara:strand:+ start:828 stop:1172 length:345 start_codon:yes stop_codon:yes gene_type:complete
MKRLLIIALMFIAANVYSQSPCGYNLCVVQFNAPWNEANDVEWLNKVSDCSKKRICIEANPDAAKKYKIYAVPTIIIFDDGEEVERFSPNIMFETDATKEEVQEAVDEQVMSDF